MLRGDDMEQPSRLSVNESALQLAIIEVKLAVNQKLYERRAITEEMFVKAKEMILRST